MDSFIKLIEETCQTASNILEYQSTSILSYNDNNNDFNNKCKKRKVSSNKLNDFAKIDIDNDFVTTKMLLNIMPHVFKSLISIDILPLPDDLNQEYFYQLNNCGNTIDFYNQFWKGEYNIIFNVYLNCLHDKLNISNKNRVLNSNYSLVNKKSISIEDVESNLFYQLSMYIENEFSNTELIYNEVYKIYKNMIIPKIDITSKSNSISSKEKQRIQNNPSLIQQLQSISVKSLNNELNKVDNVTNSHLNTNPYNPSLSLDSNAIIKTNSNNPSSSSSITLHKNNNIGNKKDNNKNQINEPSSINSTNNHSPLKQKSINKLFQPVQQKFNIPNNYRKAKVVRSEGATVRDNIDIDNSNILAKLDFNEVVYYDKIEILKGIVNETVNVARLHIYIQKDGKWMDGWASLHGRTIEDNAPILEEIILCLCPICNNDLSMMDAPARDHHVNCCLEVSWE